MVAKVINADQIDTMSTTIHTHARTHRYIHTYYRYR